MSELNFRNITYRLMRLRRLILFSAVLPLPGIFLASLFGFGLGFGTGGGFVWILWILTVLALAIRFPNAWFDHLGLGLTLGLITFFSPFGVALGLGPISGTLLILVLLPAGWLALNNLLPGTLDNIPFLDQTATFSTRADLIPGDLTDELFLKPDQRRGLFRCGPAGKDGIFEVESLGFTAPEYDCGAIESDTKFRAKIIESDTRCQVTKCYVTDADGHVTTSTVYEEVTPSRSGSIYVKQEEHEDFSVLAAAGLWLNDAEADHFTAALDTRRNAPVRALRLLPQETLLTWSGARLSEWLAKSRTPSAP